jgi:excinuclease ABC subunit C
MTEAIPAKLRARIDDLPRRPGVYLMKDRRKEVLYVGKAADLRARVRSYFQPATPDHRLITESIDEITDVDVVVTASEAEALLLECNFIKQFRPRYNVNLRDDKSFVSIRIDPSEPWPRPVVTRRLDDPGALYFGPYANARAARKALRTLQDAFPLRRCSLRQCRDRRRPCIYGEMGRCSAPCCAGVTQEEYARLLDQVIAFLRGRRDEVVRRLRTEMEEAAGELDFERAAALRDRIHAVEATLEAQHVAKSAADKDRDVFGICTVDRFVSIAVLFFRDGDLRDVATYRFPAELDSQEAIFGAFLKQFYRNSRFIPQEALLPADIEDAGLIEAWLSEAKGERVRLLRPQRGPKRHLVEMANRNAREAERAATAGEERRCLELASLQSLLGLARPPATIECFDASNLGGREAVGSMVVFRDAEPDRSSYRHYRIRSVEGQDDFAMLGEVLRRRYVRVARGEDPAPDLVLVDGGEGQLSAARRVLEEFGLSGSALAAIAKARSEGGRQFRVERVFLPGRDGATELPPDSYGFRLATRVRDEAHRFAVRYHRALRRRTTTESPLLEIPGVGRRTADRLMDRFGTLEAIAAATVDDLSAVPGLPDRVARAVARHFAARQDCS